MKLCLVIVFNHRFDKNLPTLREYYAGKFAAIRFLMPFADDLEEKETDVISVHFSSYLYQGFFGEARKRLGQIECDGYVVVGDDLLLNPSLDQSNLHQKMGLPREDAYTKGLASLFDAPLSWSRARTTYRALFADGLEWHRLLPDRDEALERSKPYGIEHRPLGFRNLSPFWTKIGLSSLGTAIAWFAERQHPRRLFSSFTKNVPYPLFYGYSDFLVLPKAGWDHFAHYCEATAAMQLFVEAAIPLAMVLAYDLVQTELEYGELFDAPHPKRRMRMRGIELQWQDSDRIDFENQHGLSLTRLIKEFPEDVLYFHPVKLSKWKQEA
jgi:hypothetical protein